MSDYYDDTLNPPPPVGGKEGVGPSPYPFNDYADVAPPAPTGHAEGVGDSPYPIGDSGVQPKMDRITGEMDIRRGQPKPGSERHTSSPNAGDLMDGGAAWPL